MGIFRDIAFGLILSRLTTIMEEVENSRYLRPIGAGGGLDSLPIRRQESFAKDLKKLTKWPRHEVTRELCKNLFLNQKLGRQSRMQAIDRLFGVLVDEGLALPMEDFEKSYF